MPRMPYIRWRASAKCRASSTDRAFAAYAMANDNATVLRFMSRVLDDGYHGRLSSPGRAPSLFNADEQYGLARHAARLLALPRRMP